MNDNSSGQITKALGRAGDWLVQSLTLSGGGKAALWTSFGRQHRPPLLPVNGQDRADLRSMRQDDRFGLAELESAIRRVDG